MSYTLTQLDDGHIILMTMHSDFDMAHEMLEASRECLPLVESGPDRIVFISDGRELRINSLNDIIQGGNAARQPEALAVNKHPKMVKALSVINSKVLNLAVRGLNSASFGFMEVTIFDSMEEALSHARSLLGIAQAS